MSTLLLDAGNTRLKWVICERGEFFQRGVFPYDWSELTTQFDAQWAAQINTGLIDRLVLCNVAGDRLEASLRQWLKTSSSQAMALQETAALTIENVTAQQQAFGVTCAYRQPAQLGADRWAALMAAHHYIAGPCCVIDCGTALTIDLLSAGGEHAGGLIAPGMTMMRQSLLANTAQLNVDGVEIESIFSVYDTAGAVQAGIIAAVRGAVQQALQQAQEQWLQVPTCVVTGGDAEIILPMLPKGSMHEPEWVLKGLAIVAGCDESLRNL